MPPPRRARDRLARALRVTADRLSGPGPAEDVPTSSDFPGSPDDVPRPPGQPPEHWRRLVAAHAPGLLRDLPPPAAPPAPSDPPPLSDPPRLSDERVQARRRRAWTTRLINRFAASGNGPSRSWYERAPTGAVSYQDLPEVLGGGTGISGSGNSGPGRGARSPGAASAGWEAGGAAPSTPTPGARSRSDGASQSWDNGASAGGPANRFVTEPSGVAGAPETPRATRISDRTGSPSAVGPTGTTSATDALGGAPPARRPAVTRALRPALTGTRGASSDGTESTRTGRPTDPGVPAGAAGPVHHAGSRDTIGSPGRVRSGESDRPSPSERRPDPDRVDPLRYLPQADRGRPTRRDDIAGADVPPDRGDMPPLAFAAAPPSLPRGPAARTKGGRTGSANGRDGTRDGSVAQYPGRVAGLPYRGGPDPASGGESGAQQGRRAVRPTYSGPWPALPDGSGPIRTTGQVATGMTEGGGTHADPWPALPAEPAWLAPRTTAWSDTTRLDREQAGD